MIGAMSWLNVTCCADTCAGQTATADANTTPARSRCRRGTPQPIIASEPPTESGEARTALDSELHTARDAQQARLENRGRIAERRPVRLRLAQYDVGVERVE